MTDFDRVKCDTATVNELNEEHLEEVTRDEPPSSWLSLTVSWPKLEDGGGLEADCGPVPPDDGDPRPPLPPGEWDQDDDRGRGSIDICTE